MAYGDPFVTREQTEGDKFLSKETRADFINQQKNDPVLYAAFLLWAHGGVSWAEIATRAAVQVSKQNAALMSLIVAHGIQPPRPEVPR